jgi:hypothetical protein
MFYIRGEDSQFREKVGDLLNFKMLDVVEWLYVPVHSMLDGFLRVIQVGHAPVAKPGYYGIYDPLTDRSKLTIRQKLQEDQIVLFESPPDFFLFTQLAGDFPVADELLDGLRLTFPMKASLFG